MQQVLRQTTDRVHLRAPIFVGQLPVVQEGILFGAGEAIVNDCLQSPINVGRRSDECHGFNFFQNTLVPTNL